MTAISQLLDEASARLKGSDSPRLDAEVLLAGVLGKSRSYLLAWPERAVSAEQIANFDTLVRQRAVGKPVAYLTGRREFWSLELEVDETTLIPRPETEMLVERALALIPPDAHWTLADLGTGSGAIALAVASERPHCLVLATDIRQPVVRLAQRNAERHGLRNIVFLCADWLAPFSARSLDMIVANPPYIAETDPHLGQGDVRFEPRRALTAGVDGLAALRVICRSARTVLKPGGHLIVEHGWDQGGAMRSLLRDEGYRDIAGFDDLAGQPRLSEARIGVR
jgi:release factor glutamine methyltransferase